MGLYTYTGLLDTVGVPARSLLFSFGRSMQGRESLMNAVRSFPGLTSVELAGTLLPSEGSGELQALLAAEGQARGWPSGVLTLKHGVSAAENFFLPSF